MFWKKIKSYCITTIWNNLPRRSITFRLTYIYTLSTCALLIFSAFFLYWIFVGRITNENEQFLENKILILQNYLQKDFNLHSSTLRDEIIVEAPLDHYFARLIDNNGHILLETPGMPEKIPMSAYEHLNLPTKKIIHTDSEKKSKKQNQIYYLLMSDDEYLVPENHSQFIIQVAKDISASHQLIVGYRFDVMIILLVGVISSILIGIITTRQSLKPLRDITRSTQHITITQLKERLNPASWPSELYTLATSFNHMLDRIEKGFNKLSQFSDDLAHEFRTPITNLMGEAEIILSKPHTNEEYQQTLASILEEFQRLAYMIDNLLFLARAESPYEIIQRCSIEISDILKDICDFYEAVAEEQEIQLIYQGEGKILADSILLRRAISNLVSNAIKHTPQGGNITIEVETNKNNFMQISVKNSGKAIAGEHLPHLFERFYRVDIDRSQKTGGTGLGLAIVKSIMDLHQGSVKITSDEAFGTVVTLYFP